MCFFFFPRFVGPWNQSQAKYTQRGLEEIGQLLAVVLVSPMWCRFRCFMFFHFFLLPFRISTIMIYHVVSASEDIGMGSTTDTWRYATGKQRFDGTSTRFAWRLLIGVGKYTVIWTLLCCTPLERPNICGFHCLGEKLQKNEHCESSWYIPFKQHKGCVSLAWYLSISIFFNTDIYIRLIYMSIPKLFVYTYPSLSIKWSIYSIYQYNSIYIYTHISTTLHISLFFCLYTYIDLFNIYQLIYDII